MHVSCGLWLGDTIYTTTCQPKEVTCNLSQASHHSRYVTVEIFLFLQIPVVGGASDDTAPMEAPSNIDSPKRKPGRPKKDSAQNSGSDGVVKRRGRPPKNPSANGSRQVSQPKVPSGRPRGRPRKVLAPPVAAEKEATMQVSFSDSESEESEALGKGMQQSGLMSSLSEKQAATGAAGSSVPIQPTAREPALLNKFEESFDEDSDN